MHACPPGRGPVFAPLSPSLQGGVKKESHSRGGHEAHKSSHRRQSSQDGGKSCEGRGPDLDKAPVRLEGRLKDLVIDTPVEVADIELELIDGPLGGTTAATTTATATAAESSPSPATESATHAVTAEPLATIESRHPVQRLNLGSSCYRGTATGAGGKCALQTGN